MKFLVEDRMIFKPRSLQFIAALALGQIACDDNPANKDEDTAPQSADAGARRGEWPGKR